MTNADADREFDQSVVINAEATQVWAVLSDVATMPQVSPEVFAILRRGSGPFRVGETFIGWNRRGPVVWPTVNKIVSAAPCTRLAWHTSSSGATWTYTLTSRGSSTVLRERRHLSDGPTLTTRLFAPVLGGLASHTDELESHVSTTLEGVKRLAES